MSPDHPSARPLSAKDLILRMAEQLYSFGDRIRSEGSPEWGVGTITRVQNLTHAGEPCQRLSARFERAGLKTILTAIIKVVPADAVPTAGDEPQTPGSHHNGTAEPEPARLGSEAHLEGRELKEIFGVLPEATRDPFSSLADRLNATLFLYKYEPTGGSLLDWASVQSRLADPLSRYSRAELEQEFQRFAYERDTHLKKLVHEARRSNDDSARAVLSSPPAHAAKAMKRFNGSR